VRERGSTAATKKKKKTELQRCARDSQVAFASIITFVALVAFFSFYFSLLYPCSIHPTDALTPRDSANDWRGYWCFRVLRYEL
jgi:hypothetical protein